MRTVREFARVRVAGIHIEDGVMPKRCSHFEGEQLVSVGEVVGKIQASVDALGDQHFPNIGWTDVRSVLGLNDAIRRAQAYVSARAGVMFAEKPNFRGRVQTRHPAPTSSVADVTEGGKSSGLGADEFGARGFELVRVSTLAITPVMKALQTFYSQLHKDPSSQPLLQQIIIHDELRLADVCAIERKPSPGALGERELSGNMKIRQVSGKPDSVHTDSCGRQIGVDPITGRDSFDRTRIVPF